MKITTKNDIKSLFYCTSKITHSYIFVRLQVH